MLSPFNWYTNTTNKSLKCDVCKTSIRVKEELIFDSDKELKFCGRNCFERKVKENILINQINEMFDFATY